MAELFLGKGAQDGGIGERLFPDFRRYDQCGYGPVGDGVVDGLQKCVGRRALIFDLDDMSDNGSKEQTPAANLSLGGSQSLESVAESFDSSTGYAITQAENARAAKLAPLRRNDNFAHQRHAEHHHRPGLEATEAILDHLAP